MSLASGVGTYSVGKYQEAGDARLGETALGGLTAPISGFLLTAYVGFPKSYSDMYRGPPFSLR